MAVCLWISGIKTKDLWALWIKDVNDKGTHIEVTYNSAKYCIQPYRVLKYDPLPVVRKYLEVLSKWSRQDILFQKVEAGKVTTGRVTMSQVELIPKQVALFLNLPNYRAYNLSSLPRHWLRVKCVLIVFVE